MATASFHPDEMSQGGLPDDFDGEIEKARFVPWDYDGNLKDDNGDPRFILAVALDIVPDDDSGLSPFTQHYSAGDIGRFVPGKSREEPVDLDGEGEDLEGFYPVKVSEKATKLSSSSNFGTFVKAMIDAEFPGEEVTDDSRVFEGAVCHWNQLPVKKRSGIIYKEREDGRERTMLLPTELRGRNKTKGKAKGASGKGASGKGASGKGSAGAGSKSKDTGDTGDTGDLAAFVLGLLAEAGGSMERTTLAGPTLKGFVSGTMSKGNAVRMVITPAFLNSWGDLWDYDADTDTVTVA